MRRIDIINIYKTLGKVRLNKVADKAMRDTLVANHLKMFRVARENDEFIASLQERFDPDAVREVNEAYQTYAGEKVDISLGKIDGKAFADMVSAGDIDITLSEVALLEPIFDKEETI